MYRFLNSLFISTSKYKLFNIIIFSAIIQLIHDTNQFYLQYI